MLINSAITIYQGSLPVDYVYQGSTLLWQRETGIPKWPEPYFNYNVTDWGNWDRGLFFFFENISSGNTLYWQWISDDCEGEGGSYNFGMKTKNGDFSNYTYPSLWYYLSSGNPITYRSSFTGWVMAGSQYDITFSNFGNIFTYHPKGMAINWGRSDCGPTLSLPSTSYTEMEIFGVFGAYGDFYSNTQGFINKMPNLKYFFTEDSGNTYTLSGSTSWTEDSMKFTEYYSPNTTFIVNDNGYWQSIIDWNIANNRNVVFKDTSGNTLTPHISASILYYKSTDGGIVSPLQTTSYYWGANLISNTYSNGVGIMAFDGNVSTIPELTFKEKSRLKDIILPNAITSIGQYAFTGCTSLENIVIPNSVTSVGTMSFDGCSSITTSILSKNMNTIANCQYRNCISLKNFVIPDNITTINYGALWGCINIDNIIIPSSVTSIGGYAFYFTGIKSIELPSSITVINEGLLGNCRSLTSVSIPNTITSIGAYGLYGCSALSGLTIPYSITSIGKNAFSYCKALSTLNFTGTISQWNAITKDSSWKGTSSSSLIPATVVHCTDGDVSI